jgi:Tol biopolymer transport system component
VTFPPSDYWGDSYVRVSPDGREVAVARTRALGVTDIYIAPAEGSGDARRITDDRLKVHGLSWSPDGKQIYFSSNRAGAFGVWRVAISGQEPQPVTAGGVNADSVALARNGARLIYETETATTRIWTASLAEGAPPRAVSQATGYDWHPAISPEGARIAFVSDRSGSPELWISGVDGSSPQKMTSFGGPYALSPAWAPDGSAVLISSPVEGNFDIYLVNAETGAMRRITDHPAADRNAAWSPDGRAVYFGSNRTGRWEIWRLDLETNHIEQITRNGGFRAQIAGDGGIFYVKREAPGVFAIDPGSGVDERLVMEELLPLDWSNWSVVGSDIISVRRGKNIAAQIVRLNADTGESTLIRPLPDFPHNSGISISPDGGFVVFTRTEIIESDLMMMERLSAANARS